MKFTSPMPFQEALDAANVRSLLPTTGTSSDLSNLSSEIKQRAMFSATTESGELLQKYSDLVDKILDGTIGQTQARVAIKSLLAEMGYQPNPDQEGSIQDLSSTSRIDLVLETNVDSARGYGQWAQGQQADVLDE